MKSVVNKSILKTLSVILVILLGYPVLSQDIPARPDPPRLVNDLAGILTPDQVRKLETDLVNFNDRTFFSFCWHIFIIIYNDLFKQSIRIENHSKDCVSGNNRHDAVHNCIGGSSPNPFTALPGFDR